MHQSSFGNDFIHLKNFGVATNASIWSLVIFHRVGSAVAVLVFATWTVSSKVANSTIDLKIDQKWQKVLDFSLIVLPRRRGLQWLHSNEVGCGKQCTKSIFCDTILAWYSSFLLQIPRETGYIKKNHFDIVNWAWHQLDIRLSCLRCAILHVDFQNLWSFYPLKIPHRFNKLFWKFSCYYAPIFTVLSICSNWTMFSCELESFKYPEKYLITFFMGLVITSSKVFCSLLFFSGYLKL